MCQPARHSTARIPHDNIVQIMVIRAVLIGFDDPIRPNHRAGDEDRDLNGA